MGDLGEAETPRHPHSGPSHSLSSMEKFCSMDERVHGGGGYPGCEWVVNAGSGVVVQWQE